MMSATHPQNPPPATPQQQPGQPQPHAPAHPVHASPPSKRDLKSWWRGFKVQSKHQESAGRDPFSSAPPDSLFEEDVDCERSGRDELLAEILRRQDSLAVLNAVPQSSDVQPGVVRVDSKLEKLSNIVRSPFRSSTGSSSSRPLTKPNSADTRPHGIFGVPLRQSITYANVAISLVDENGQSYIYGYVPIVVAKCGVFLKEKATGIEGIFRLSGSEKRIKELKLAFDSPDRYGKGLVWEGYTVHDAATVFRRYLNDLPEPVVPLDLYEKFREPLRGATKQAVGDAEGPHFVENFDLDAAIATYQHLITGLPPLNRQLLLYILDLLAVFAAKADENRMNSQNLAAIFQPGMLSHPNHAMAPEEYRLNQCVIIFLIENQDHFLIGMHGTAADEKTVKEVQGGTPNSPGPSTPGKTRKSGIARSSSNASAGAESVARDGKIRRNRSTSSRQSRQSNGNGGPSPASPALAATPTGGLGRSNTVPSKKSPALSSGRFPKRPDQPGSPVAPLTPLGHSQTVSETPAVETVVTSPDEHAHARAMTSAAAAGAADILASQAGYSNRNQEGFLGPTEAAVTPSKERKLPNRFQRTATSESDTRQPKKLRKKRQPGSANPSAHTSTSSLPHSAVISPNIESSNPMERHHVPPAEMLPASLPNQSTTDTTPSEPTPRASLVPSSSNPGPSSSDSMLKPRKSPPTSLHSSFNEGSDIDQVDDIPAPAEHAEPEKEKKKRWRMSRRKDDNSQHMGNTIGTNTHADMSTSSIGSGGHKTRASWTGDMSDPALIAGIEGQLSHEGALREGRDGQEESRGLKGWIKNKYREARNKSPPADRGPGSVSTTSTLPARGKSVDLRPPTEEEKAGPSQAPKL